MAIRYPASDRTGQNCTLWAVRDDQRPARLRRQRLRDSVGIAAQTGHRWRCCWRRVRLRLAGLCLLAGAAGSLAAEPVPTHEFAFARLVYGSSGVSLWPRWQADWPDAETHFSAGLERLTRVDVAPEGVLVDIRGSELFDFPWLYAVEVGSLSFTPAEASRLREYLIRGGFLMVDDFHGVQEWSNFARAIRQVFPHRPLQDLSPDHETFHVLYDLAAREQIPGIRALMDNRTWEKGGRQARWRGILDDHGRVMVAINFNQDIGDAWEHADDAVYPQRYSAQAYRLGVNYVVYAMTH